MSRLAIASLLVDVAPNSAGLQSSFLGRAIAMSACLHDLTVHVRQYGAGARDVVASGGNSGGQRDQAMDQPSKQIRTQQPARRFARKLDLAGRCLVARRADSLLRPIHFGRSEQDHDNTRTIIDGSSATSEATFGLASRHPLKSWWETTACITVSRAPVVMSTGFKSLRR